MRKTDVEGIYKVQDGVLINKDNDALVAYKKRKARENYVNSFQDQIDDLKSDITEIKNLLKGLVK